MPATDSCEPRVINALQKDGWTVVARQIHMRIGKARTAHVSDGVYPDLLIQKNGQSLVVEIKCFSGTRSYTDEFYHSIGQCQVYQHAVEMSGSDAQVYLAVPFEPYTELTQMEAIQRTLKNAKINFILIDLNREETVQWIHQP